MISVTPPAQRVQFILGEEEDDGTHESHPLFSEMEELVQDGGEMEWKETARYEMKCVSTKIFIISISVYTDNCVFCIFTDTLLLSLV
jgi:hypothetical protein